LNILIDTNVLYWLSEDVAKLGSQTLKYLIDNSNKLYVSYFSLVELIFKAGSGKITIDLNYLLKKISESDIDIVMPDTDSLKDYKVYNPRNKDPFDNLLITIARINRLTMITADQDILAIKTTRFTSLNARA
jgi:PIN domain nuclease of toxin-antitoxin system